MIQYNFTPLHPKIEMHITYNCNLACRPCSRACFLQETHTENMDFKDLGKLKKQLDKINWELRHILITGGEPTLHPNFLEIVEEALEKDEG